MELSGCIRRWQANKVVVGGHTRGGGKRDAVNGDRWRQMRTDKERASDWRPFAGLFAFCCSLFLLTTSHERRSSKRFRKANGRVHEGRAVLSMASRSADVTRRVCFVEIKALSCCPAVLLC